MAENANNNTKDMTEGSPARLILFFTLPLIAGNIFQQLYGFVDTLIVGRFLGESPGCGGLHRLPDVSFGGLHHGHDSRADHYYRAAFRCQGL